MFRLLKSLPPLALLLPTLAQAGFGIDATRLVYPQAERSISVTLRNTDASTPYLTQATVSRAVERAKPAPFDVTPPLFRLEPNSTNQVRIIARDTANLPADRESLFYFRTSAIPSTAGQQQDGQEPRIQGSVQFGVGNIIKLFYRPSGLPGSAADAQRGLQFSRLGKDLRVSNPSPYFVSFAGVSLNGKKLPLDAPQAKMLAPFASYTWKNAGAGSSVKWETIGDEGGKNAFSHTLP